jgi:hypothetical protein
MGCAAVLVVRGPEGDTSDDLSHKSERCDQLASDGLSYRIISQFHYSCLKRETSSSYGTLVLCRDCKVNRPQEKWIGLQNTYMGGLQTETKCWVWQVINLARNGLGRIAKHWMQRIVLKTQSLFQWWYGASTASLSSVYLVSWLGAVKTLPNW